MVNNAENSSSLPGYRNGNEIDVDMTIWKGGREEEEMGCECGRRTEKSSESNARTWQI